MKNSLSDLKNISDEGYLILKNCISPKLIKLLQKKIMYQFSNTKKNSYQNFEKKCSKLKNKRLFEIINPINKILINEGFLKQILNEKKLFNHLVGLLGSDLAVSNESSLTINLSKTNDNYYFKDWHQEIWSGASVSHIQIWLPIIQKTIQDGQISFIKDSHKWGHVPHSNRAPVKLPEKFKTIQTNLAIGDVVIFCTTLMHKSMPTMNPRMALAMTVKNYKYKDMSFSDNQDWNIFSHSEVTKIQRVLGNHYLSPFRLVNKEKKFKDI
jgi:ectoine hydroxylase-related dioxygenase (phytanoyl-CoA dioxygenase family)